MIVTFAIGNSDDKLPQAAWSAFVGDVHSAVDQVVIGGGRIQFAGYSAPGAPWQNALWAVELPDWEPGVREALRTQLAELARTYRQDSIAWWETDRAEFLAPAPAVIR